MGMPVAYRRRCPGSVSPAHYKENNLLRILVIGDIIGRAGRQVLAKLLSSLKTQYQVDLCIANVENVAGGIGITPVLARELLLQGVDVLTSGNHIWDKKEIESYAYTEKRLLRPANYPPGAPGGGGYLARLADGQSVGVVNLAGRVFMQPLDCPFRAAKSEVGKLKEYTSVILVDFHAEATSEKVAMGWYLDGLVSAVVGTHTHVQTADERILPKGTAYITDIGMTGPTDSVIGIQKELALQRFLTQMPVKFEPAKGSPQLNGVVIEVDPASGKAGSIQRLRVSPPTGKVAAQ